MGGLAFVFPGQGDQHPGMGARLYLNYRSAAETMDQFDRLRPGTLEQCFAGTDEELKVTSNAQPCLFAVELAAASALAQCGITPDAVAGFSLGELSAAAYVGIFDYETAFHLVCKRGKLMERAAAESFTFMAAVLALNREQVETICESLEGVYPVNYNCPGQTVVSGPENLMQSLKVSVKELGGRVATLNVQGGFHSPYMKSAAEEFSTELKAATVGRPAMPIYSNVTALPYGDARSLLVRQIHTPVRWEDTIRNMISSGIDLFVEVGPGRTLSNMIRRIDGSVSTFCTSDIDAILKETRRC